jgi:hypothetical protein
MPGAPGVGRWIIIAFFASIYLLSDARSVLWPERRGRPCLPDDEVNLYLLISILLFLIQY